jgi:YesN/AraC family two-component response regulator
VISIVIADDQDLVRTGFPIILEGEPDVQVVAEARDGREAVELTRSRHPDVILMDIGMPVLDAAGAVLRHRWMAAAPGAVRNFANCIAVISRKPLSG